jgi:hypothetical protein
MLNRRQAIVLLAGGAPALKLARADATVQLEITPGPFKGTREFASLCSGRERTRHGDGDVAQDCQPECRLPT